MSLSGCVWQQQASTKDEIISQLVKETAYSPAVIKILYQRGITQAADITEFLNPKLTTLTSPFDLPDMAKAVERVMQAKAQGEKVAVFGDYDVDGITGTIVLLEALRKIGITAEYYIPHRHDEGYSLNAEAIHKLHAQGVAVLVTVDCGISKVSEVELANQLGITVIITDHHNPSAELPPAYAVVDPKLGDAVKVRDLSGVAVAFKFAWALYRSAGISGDSEIKEALDLVGLGTIADISPLVYENRILAAFGLRYLSDSRRPGIRALKEIAGVTDPVNAHAVSFFLAPRLNAAGRVAHAELAVELLLAQNETEAKERALALNRLNGERQALGSAVAEAADSQVKEVGDFLFLSGEGWHPGVIGIVASGLADKYSRPTILVAVENGQGKGSARGIPGFNLFGFLESAKELFQDFGGHENACGFTIASGQIRILESRLNAAFPQWAGENIFSPKIAVDAELTPEEISMSLAAEIALLEPFGNGNPPPVFLTRDLKLLEIRPVGKGDHVQVKLGSGERVMEGIGFGWGRKLKSLRVADIVDMLFHLEIDRFRNREKVRLRIVDMDKRG
ncbi:MAG: single-stranded-DNA-specific exonuclease RecJ [Candidatus Margulisiibacteriota bacterium]